MGFLPFRYEASVVVASFLIASLASYVALDLAQRMRRPDRGIAPGWWIAGSLTMGTGIWCMHFIGMLAFSLPIALGYTHGLTTASWAAAVSVSVVALFVGSMPTLTWRTLSAGALAMGVGICAMHYIGMAALDMQPGIVWSSALVATSVAIAVGASAVALLLVFWASTASARRGHLRVGAALLMGAAICGMHYTGMAAVSVYLEPVPTGGIGGIRPLTMIVPITLITAAVIIGVALSGLQAMTEEEFTNGAGTPKRGVHADHTSPWSLRQASLSAARRTTVQRPSRRPLPVRGTTSGS